jgi:hypothetical protein
MLYFRKANVSKAEVAIKREIHYKKMHGPEVKTYDMPRVFVAFTKEEKHKN